MSTTLQQLYTSKNIKIGYMVQYINCSYIDKKCTTVETEVTNNYGIISSGVFTVPVNKII
jgi:hypothetical protein